MTDYLCFREIHFQLRRGRGAIRGGGGAVWCVSRSSVKTRNNPRAFGIFAPKRKQDKARNKTNRAVIRFRAPLH
jgi:hypothetical protein